MKIILPLGEDNQVLQVDMSLPDYACTIMHEQPDLDRLMRRQRIDVDLPVFDISRRQVQTAGSDFKSDPVIH